MKFLYQLFTELKLPLQRPIIINKDNAGALFIVNNATVGQRTKHIDTRYHFVRELVENNVLRITYIPTDENPANLFTKNLVNEKHDNFTTIIMNPDLQIEKKGGC